MSVKGWMLAAHACYEKGQRAGGKGRDPGVNEAGLKSTRSGRREGKKWIHKVAGPG